MLSINFSEPRWLINFYHILGVISIILNIFGIYLLIFQCKKLGFFRYYLLGFQVFCVLPDIHLSCLVQPIPLAPLLSAFTVGILSNYFDVSTHVCVLIGGFIASLQLESLILCFLKKHQTIGEVLRKHKIPSVLVYFLYFLCIVCPIILLALTHAIYISKEEQLDFIAKNHPNLLQGYQGLSHFVLYIQRPIFTFYILMVLFGGTTLLIIFISFIIDIFRLMITLKQRISHLSYIKHHDAMRCLLVQFFTSILCVMPPCLLVVIVAAEIDESQFISELLVAWFTSHSSVNMISLCFFFPPYRSFFVKTFRKGHKRIAPTVSSTVI